MLRSTDKEENTMKKNLLFVFCSLAFVFSAMLFAQSSSNPDIRRRLEMIENGQAEAVRGELPSLMTNYQNNPGVIYLQAVLTADGSEAAILYQNIVDNFPKSEWADDALYKLYEYYYSMGLYKTADQKLQQLKEEYPFSAYASEKSPVAEKKAEKKEKPLTLKPKSTVQKYSAGFTVQVGAFSTLPNAEELKAKFEHEGYSSDVFTIVSHGKKLHKVWVGEYKTYDEAKKQTAVLKEKFNLSSIVVSR
jgi:hypothetical protein